MAERDEVARATANATLYGLLALLAALEDRDALGTPVIDEIVNELISVLPPGLGDMVGRSAAKLRPTRD